MIALLHQLPSEAKIRKHLRKVIFGKNMYCPRCHSRKVYVSEDRYRCRKCRKPFTLFSETWLQGMKLSLRTFWSLLWCWTQKIPVRQTSKLCHVSEYTVYHWFREFRLHLPEFDSILHGVIQMDEAYFKNWALVLAKQIGSKRVACQMLPKKRIINKTEAAEFLFQYIAPRSKLQTDGGSMYKNIENWWPIQHKTDIHRKFEFRLTSEIEGMFGNLRTFIRRMYHHVTPEYLPEYVSEFCLRFSSPELFNNPLNYLEKSIHSVPLD